MAEAVEEAHMLSQAEGTEEPADEVPGSERPQIQLGVPHRIILFGDGLHTWNPATQDHLKRFTSKLSSARGRGERHDGLSWVLLHRHLDGRAGHNGHEKSDKGQDEGRHPRMARMVD